MLTGEINFFFCYFWDHLLQIFIYLCLFGVTFHNLLQIINRLRSRIIIWSANSFAPFSCNSCYILWLICNFYLSFSLWSFYLKAYVLTAVSLIKLVFKTTMMLRAHITCYLLSSLWSFWSDMWGSFKTFFPFLYGFQILSFARLYFFFIDAV